MDNNNNLSMMDTVKLCAEYVALGLIIPSAIRSRLDEESLTALEKLRK